MKKSEADRYHHLIGVQSRRMTFRDGDFLDYVIMICLCGIALVCIYGIDNLLTQIGLVACALMIINFPLRHGFKLKTPLIVKRPQDILYMVVYRLTNLEPIILIAAAILILENVAIYFTPQLPHKVELVRQVGFYLIYLNFAIITIYRTAILAAHLYKRNLAKEVLLETPWKRVVVKHPSMFLEIFHSYFTGILAHIMMLIPWFLVVSYFDFSIIFIPIICVANYVVFSKSLAGILRWYYRDHWLAHNSELEFIYLHGAHHDAIPSALLAADESGFLEGIIRQMLGRPIAMFNPLMAFIFYTNSIWKNVTDHQYIPGIFPKQKNPGRSQHAIHHHNRLEPYGLAYNLEIYKHILPEKQREKIERMSDREQEAYRLDEILNGFEWNNAKYRWYLQLVKKYNSRQ
ncbi:hypothetical protein [Teredinibacter haidensis]|uniref:hypothetical protein n=1 Tax=Teredinibacter haidensis TaxID=2731755 RepID=UPI000948EEDF|nr:hypothetical protein [Teredinibacter haidensis]